MKCIIDIPEIPTNDKQRWVLANGTPYPHGEWIKEGGIFYQLKCSNCNFELRSPDDKSNFCPNCGARMEAGDPDAQR